MHVLSALDLFLISLLCFDLVIYLVGFTCQSDAMMSVFDLGACL